MGVIPNDWASKTESNSLPSWDRLDPKEFNAPPCVILEYEWILNSLTSDKGKGKICIFFCNLFRNIFLANNSMLNIPGSKDMVWIFLYISL